MLLELERECLEVYRRKVEEAANAKACLHHSVAAKEAELATLMAALGELNLHSPIQAERSASLKEKLASVTPLVEELKMKKEERMKQFADTKDKELDEQDLSQRKLAEYQTQLHTLQKEKSDHLHKVLENENEVHSLYGVLGLDFGQTVSDVHPSLHGTSVEQSINVSNSTLEGLEQAIAKLKIERKARLLKLKDIVASLLELWNLMDSPKEEMPTLGLH
ncbi:65-kDa microtubule-associated protein 6-like [Carya illinoinensis]|uniref:65-kDa microtubule-associated protein 6-like n=1 Tax=Carya illinoinensis TaxID=32201 RepID=UPI001C725819|nr:65-kDa microtubule-associated protein 6-like [Carya illinoinensis]